jgi:hypothetical protein
VKRNFIKGFVIACVVCIAALLSVRAWAEDQDLTYSVSFTDDELDDLLAPIALYPDPLLAQILPASTYPSEVADAEAWLNSGGNDSDIDEQDWAESVRAISHYPDILHMMAGNMDWTANLGDAFLNQPEDVTNSIQRLRWRARAVGNLTSNDEQSVVIEGDYIQIVPAQPQYVFVPQYDTSVVYVQAPPPGMSPFITFGFGLMIGDWLSMDFDWGHHYVFYHGWDRPGWVNHARPYVHIRNVYVNRSRPFINRTWRHDRSHGDPARYLASRPSGPNAHRYRRIGEARGSITIQPRSSGTIYSTEGDARAYSNRGRESRGIVRQQPTQSTPGISRRPATPVPGVREQRAMPTPYAGRRVRIPAAGSSQRQTPVTPHVGGIGSNRPASSRTVRQPARTPSVTFGGYRGASETKTQSLRGQTSRQSLERGRPSTGPARSGGVPAGRGSSGDRQRR